METLALNSTLDQIDLMNVYRTFHPKAAEYTFFSITHGTFFSIDHMLGHKTSLNKFKKIEISSIFSDHNSMRLEINYKKKTKNHKHVESKHTLLTNQWIKEEIKGESKNIFKQMKVEAQHIKTHGIHQKQC